MSGLISIILPVYNGQQFLNSSIESCLNQTYQNFELIIIDDCSTDDSYAIAQISKKKDSRIKLFKNKKNSGLPATLNFGHKHAMGNYITWTSDDNIYEPNALEKMLFNLKNSKAAFVYANCKVIDEKGFDSGFLKAKSPENIYFGNCVGACFLYTQLFYEKNGLYDEELVYVEDYEYWLRGLKHSKYFNLEETLYNYRVHSENLSAAINSNSFKKKVFRNNLKKAIFKNVGSYKELSHYLIGLQFKKGDVEIRPLQKIDILKQAKEFNLTQIGSKINAIQRIVLDKTVDFIFLNTTYHTLSSLLFAIKTGYFTNSSHSYKRRLAFVRICLF